MIDTEMEHDPYQPTRNIGVAPSGHAGNPKVPYGSTDVVAIVLGIISLAIGIYGVCGCAAFALRGRSSIPSGREFILKDELALTVMWLLFGVTFAISARYRNPSISVLLPAAPLIAFGALVLRSLVLHL